MKKLLLFFSIVITAIQVFSQNSVIESKWTSTPILADGNYSDWNSQPFLLDQSSKLYYAIANDSSNIYLCFKVSKSFTQMQIVRAGLNIKLVSKNSKGRIKYPLKMKNDTETEIGFPKTGKHDGFDAKWLKQLYRQTNATMAIKGFNTKKGIYSTNTKNWINVALGWDDIENMYYEVTIPFKNYFGENYTKQDLLKEITLKVDLETTDEPMNRGDRPGSGGGVAGPGGNRPSGGGRGQGGGISGGFQPDGNMHAKVEFQNRRNATPLNLKKKFKLSFE